MLELPDDTELNDLVIMSIFLTKKCLVHFIISYIYIPINFNLSF